MKYNINSVHAHTINTRDANRLNKLVLKTSSIARAGVLDSGCGCGEGRMSRKLDSILESSPHPLYDEPMEIRHQFNNQLIPPSQTTQRLVSGSVSESVHWAGRRHAQQSELDQQHKNFKTFKVLLLRLDP